MQAKAKWEYRIEGGIVGGSILQELNKLGDEGWELAGLIQAMEVDKSKVYYFFKRLK
jgi:translation initiation factor 2 gamma subunit (eIF-2gamma)